MAADGWTITIGARHEPDRDDFPCVTLDRDEHGALRVADGFELLVDVIPFEARHAEELLELDVGAIVAISSASVYADEQGRTLDEAQGVDDFPEFPLPIPETQPTVAPGEATYSTKKAAIVSGPSLRIRSSTSATRREANAASVSPGKPSR